MPGRVSGEGGPGYSSTWMGMASSSVHDPIPAPCFREITIGGTRRGLQSQTRPDAKKKKWIGSCKRVLGGQIKIAHWVARLVGADDTQDKAVVSQVPN